MSDLGDTFKAMREDSRKRRTQNHCRALEALRAHGITVEILSSHHYRIGRFDFWPSTGKFLNRETKKYSRGVDNLIKQIKHDLSRPLKEE